MNWQAVVENTVTGLGYDLVDTERSVRGLLRVFIDKLPDASGQVVGYIQVDDCERVTRQLQHVLEVEGCAYERLEVSSPGLDRPLKRPTDFTRFIGEQIDLGLKLPFQGRKHYKGTLAERPDGGEGWRLEFNDGKSDLALDFTFDEVREARLIPVVDFKGRRFAAPAEAESGNEQPADDGANGERNE